MELNTHYSRISRADGLPVRLSNYTSKQVTVNAGISLFCPHLIRGQTMACSDHRTLSTQYFSLY